MFNLFGSKKNEKAINLLQKAQADFAFDQTSVKRRLLISIEEHQLSTAEKLVRERTHKTFLRRHRLATASTLLLLVIVGTGATLAQADISNPGDRFHTLDQWGEKFLLILPLSEKMKTEMQVNIADERTRELDYLLEAQTINPAVTAKAVRQSQETLEQAIEATMSVKEKSIINGKQRQSDKMDEVLVRLQELAKEQERKVEVLLEQESDQKTKEELKKRIEDIRKARLRARVDDKPIDKPIIDLEIK